MGTRPAAVSRNSPSSLSVCPLLPGLRLLDCSVIPAAWVFVLAGCACTTNIGVSKRNISSFVFIDVLCDGLVPCLTFFATEKGFPNPDLDATALCRGLSRSLLPKMASLSAFKMPRPCTVVFHVRCYQKWLPYLRSRCHGLVPWSFTFAATKKASLSAFKMPRPCAVVFHVHCYQEGFPICVQD